MATFIDLFGELTPVHEAELFLHKFLVKDLFAGLADPESRAIGVNVHGKSNSHGQWVVFGEIHVFLFV